MINDVTELVAEASRVSGRGDLANYAPLLLGSLEGQLNARLRVGDMESIIPFVTDADGTFTLPPDWTSYFLGVISITCGPNKTALNHLPKNMLNCGLRGWCILNDTVYSSERDTAHELVYYQAIPALWEHSTNWLLRRKPEVYLQGLVFEAHKDAGNAEAAVRHKALLDMAIDTLVRDDNAVRHANVVVLPRTLM